MSRFSPLVLIAVLAAAGLSLPGTAEAATCSTARLPLPDASCASSAAVPRPDHILVVIDENHAQGEIVGSANAPYITGLSRSGANFTNSHAVAHPSQPNYLAVFSGSTQGVTSDTCPKKAFTTADLGGQALAAHIGFDGYSESMPSDGYTGCTSGNYARKHNPWVDFADVPASSNLRFTDFPTDYTKLPAVSVVVPNLQDDMHDGTIQQGDTWLKQHLDGYIQWAKTHNSLFVLTFDEDDFTTANQIPTVITGAGVKTGNYAENISHYNVLRTIEDAYSLPHAGSAATATPITDIWG